MEDILLKHLIDSQVEESDLKNEVIPLLLDKGCKKVADLEYLEEEDLEGFKPIVKRRLWRFIHSDKWQVASNGEAQDELEEQSGIYIRYMLCSTDFFAKDTSEQRITDINPMKEKLADIVQRICNENNIPPDQTIELYSNDGYPLQNIEITGNAVLKAWRISDGDFFYVIPRLKDQPGHKEFVSLPTLDHNIGQETFIIETPFHGNLPVNAYMDCDSPEDIAQKVYSITGLQVPFMSLFIRRGYSHERLTAFSELKDRDCIRVVLQNPLEIINPRSSYYGQRSYNFLVPQTEHGIMKLFTIIKFLCSAQPYNKEYDFEKFLSYLMTLTGFPPMVYALRLLKETTHLPIAGWTALIEGCYLLFRAILDNFATVEDKNVFEYSDYIWSMILSKSHDIQDIGNVESELCSLICPLSGTRLRNPVRVPGHSFDKDNIKAAIESGDPLSYGKITTQDLKEDCETAQLLMYFPWETDRKVPIWTSPRKEVIPMVCRKVEMSFNWFEMLQSLTELCIVDPKGLYSGEECLTYNCKGQLVYFMGSAKSTDENRKFYNPCITHDKYQEVVTKTELDKIESSLNVIADFGKVLKNRHLFSYEIAQSDSVRKSAIIPPQNSIQWDIEEAIVVLFDNSGSMGAQVFKEIDKLTRIVAAKELFNIFATRTQAYKLHHALGLTLFSSEITVKLGITKNIEDFETSLKDIEATYMTSLTLAVVKAVDQLKTYDCRKRILCLTDGYNSCDTPYQTALSSAKDNNVIVDTVLLTWPDDNSSQKALSHATGGVCVLPKTMQEALRYFELDAMLSLKERVLNCDTSLVDLTVFQDVEQYPYETESSFKSNYVQAFQSVKTSTIQSYVKQQKPTLSRHRRILKELKEFIHNPHHSIIVYPSVEYHKWKVLMCAPEDTPYKGGTFVLSVEFPNKYPLCPPEIRFLTLIYHCNVSGSSGRICHNILGESYTPSTSMRDIMCYIYGLLMCPDMDTPLDSALADGYGYHHDHTDHTEGYEKYFAAANKYFEKAASDVKLYATKPLDQLKKELSG